MIITTLITLITIITITIPFNSSIVSLGAVLIITALTVTVLISSIIGSWFGFILFLIYITGLLVLFGYILAISPNHFHTSNKSANIITTTVVTSLFLVINTSINTNPSPTSHSSFENTVLQIYINTNIAFYWIIAIVLLITLIIAVNLCYNSPNPLRPFITE